MGGLKEQIIAGGQKPPAHFCAPRAPGVNRVMWRRRGVIGEHVADEKAAKKHFHVPATSLEVLSAIRRHCWDMEVLFSGFHIGDVGRGVVGGGRDRRCGRLVVSRMCGAVGGWCFVASTQEQKKAP